MFIGKDGELGTEYKKVHCRHLLIELFWQEIEIVLVGLKNNHPECKRTPISCSEEFCQQSNSAHSSTVMCRLRTIMVGVL